MKTEIQQEFETLQTMLNDLNNLKQRITMKGRTVFLEFLKEKYPKLVEIAEQRLKILNPNGKLIGAFILKSHFNNSEVGLDNVKTQELVFNTDNNTIEQNGIYTIHILDNADFGDNYFDEFEAVNYFGSELETELHICNSLDDEVKKISDLLGITDIYPTGLKLDEIDRFNNLYTFESNN